MTLMLIIERMFDDLVPAQQAHIRMVRPPQRVWVNLAAVYGIDRTGPIRAPYGMELRYGVHGELVMWDRASTGEWFGWVLFSIRGVTGGGARVSQWIRSDALAPRE